MRRLPLLAFVALLLAPAAAHAQTTTVTKNAALVSITHPDGRLVQGPVNNQWYVNRRDCGLDTYDPATDLPTNVFMNIDVARVSTVDFGNNPLVYVGTSCNTGANRTGSTTAPCVQANGNTSNSPLRRSGTGLTGYSIPLESVRPIATASNASTYDLCNPQRNSSLDIYIMPESTGSSDASTYVLLTIFGDMALPVSPEITTANPQGDNSVDISWTTGGTYEVLGELHYFALPGGCGSTGGDGGTDAGSTDAGTGTDGGTIVVGGSLTEGELPPLILAGIYRGSGASTGSSSIETSKIGLTTTGETAALGMSIRDAAGNFSVLSNVVCVQRITTYGLCEASGGNCPHGGCAIASNGEGPFSIGGFAIALVTLAWLVIRRGGRS